MFEFLQLLIYRTCPRDGQTGTANPPALARRAHENEKFGNNIVTLPALVGLVVFIVPSGLLIAMQVRFLPYQSEFITRFRQIVVTPDVVIQGVFLGYAPVFSAIGFPN